MPRRPEPNWKIALGAIFETSRRIVVLGIGNAGRGDDAAGVLIATKLVRFGPTSPRTPETKSRAVKIIVGHDIPESTTGEIRAFSPDVAILVDSAAGKEPPGTIALISSKNIAEDAFLTHRVPLRLLIRYLEEGVGCRVVLLGIQPKTTVPGSPISRPVRKAIADIIGFLSNKLFL
jgi:hydrogenase 3 maturation protease